MLQDVINCTSEQLQIEEFSSPFGAQMFEFCDPELFIETIQNSEVDSNSNCCYDENSPYSFSQETNNFTNTINTNYNANTNVATATSASPTTPTTTTTTNNNSSNFSIIFDSPDDLENDISASIDFSPSPPLSTPQFSLPPFMNPQQCQYDFSSLQSQIPQTDFLDGFSHFPIMGQPLPAVYEDECLSSMPSCSFLDHTMGPYLQGNLSSGFSTENSGIFSGGLVMGNELQSQELDYEGDNGGIFCPDPLPQIFNSSELQALSNESQHIVNGCGSSTPLGSEISSLENPTYKVGKLSVEERKEKIHRYMKKRNERNFSKKIKYACRKTLADSRPRVRGRFAKNDELGENTRTTCSNLEEDTDEYVVVKEEDDITSDIFAHISGVNSFKCNYPIQSWI